MTKTKSRLIGNNVFLKKYKYTKKYDRHNKFDYRFQVINLN